MSIAWTDEELAASVDAYRQMAAKDATGERYSKKHIYRDLADRFNRTEKSFEYRMQNISAVLDELGLPWVSGLKPASNIGAGVKPRLVALITGSPRTVGDIKRPPGDYKAKLPALRNWLIQVARAGEKVAYSDVMVAFDIDRFSLRHAMDYLGHEAKDRDEPILTALIVGKQSGVCSVGLKNEFGVLDDALERQRLYDFWGGHASVDSEADDSDLPSLTIKAIRFASVAARPNQAAFRRRVFIAWDGQCALTGCDARAALDAAHRHGRDWRLGHNHASDGLLLRKDLHALYDAKLITVSALGVVEVDGKISKHYGQYAGLRLPARQ